MEFKIKQEPGLLCDYTKNSASVLVQLVDINGNSTAWISASALRNALNLIISLESNSTHDFDTELQRIPHFDPAHLQPENMVKTGVSAVAPIQEMFQTPKPPLSRKESEDKRMLDALREDCIELAENPPPDAKGRQDGVQESHIRELMGRYKPRLSNPKAMFSVLNAIFGMDKSRFDCLLEL